MCREAVNQISSLLMLYREQKLVSRAISLTSLN